MRPSESSGPPAEPASHRRLRELAARAQAGDPRAVPALRDFLREEPEIAAWLGDLSRHVRSAWVGLMAGADPAVREAAAMRAEARRDELAGPAAPPTERLLADLIVNLELEVHESSLALAVNPDAPPAVAAARVRRADSAVRRLLKAAQMLRDVQTLLPNGQAPGPRLGLFDPAGRRTG